MGCAIIMRREESTWIKYTIDIEKANRSVLELMWVI